MKQAPKAKKIPFKLEKFDDVRIDNYYWLREKDNPEVIEYLNAENSYFEAKTKAYKHLEKRLFEEMRSRIKKDDESVPVLENDYFYQTKYLKGLEYPQYLRWKNTPEAKPEIFIDVNQLAENHSFYHLTDLEVSPNNQLVVFGEDTTGRRKYKLRIKNLKTGQFLKDEIPNTTGSAVWANDNQTLFYTKKDPVTLRAYRIYKHKLGTPVEDDELVYEEKNEIYSAYVSKSKTNQYIYIISISTLTTEYQFIRADQPDEKFRIFSPRQQGVEYNLFHQNNHFLILTNIDKAVNFKLMKTSTEQTDSKHWKELIPHRNDVLLEDVEVFNDFFILEERKLGLNKLRVISDKDDFYIDVDEETYNLQIGYNPEMNTRKFRYLYNSMTTPSSVYEFDIDTHQKKLLKEQEIPDSTFDKNNYQSKRLWVPSRDGKKIPVSLVYRKDINLEKTNPLLLYGYGSYGITIDPGFSTTRLSLLDRGFIFAIAHVRGGEYLGRPWYEDGKLLKKKNTFNDFIDVARYLINKKYTAAHQLFAMGGSAGGLLMGAVINQAPDLFKGIVAQVPFVDVLTTMLDDTIPLTTGEYDEWGNPNQKEYYDYIKSYSPYDKIKKQNYPNMLVVTGLHDSQVQYWEPAKWVAKLRELKTDDNLLLLYTDMDTGHSGASGRFRSLIDVARNYAFIIHLKNQAV